MENEKDGTAKWIAAALDVLAEGGIDQVRVEVVAERLGVTKGGFYRRFKDRRALLDIILDEWGRGRIAAIDRQTERSDIGPREQLKSLIELYSSRVSARGLAIELAIRQWARNDATVAAAVGRVDAYRLGKACFLYRKLGLTAEEAQSRAILLYSFIFGQSLLFLDAAPRTRASLLASCASTLTDVE